MVTTATFEEWLVCLDIRTGTRGPAGSEVLEIRDRDSGAVLAVIKPDGVAGWSVVHERRIPRSTLEATWCGPDGSEVASANVAEAARRVAMGFPLVGAESHDLAGDVLLILTAPLCRDGLTGQGFLLTVSAVLKAAEAFDLVAAGTAAEVDAWADVESLAERRRAEQHALIENAVRLPSPSTPADTERDAPTAARPHRPGAHRAAAPTEVMPPARPDLEYTVPARGMYAWTTPDSTRPHTATLTGGVSLRVVERWGDWARVVADNGWTGWVDGRLLESP